MEEKIAFLKKLYLFFCMLILIFYFTHSFFVENFGDSFQKIKNLSLFLKVNKKTIVLDKDGKWLYLAGSGFNAGRYGYLISDKFFIEGKRGFNIIVIGDNKIKAGNFDTHKYIEESKRMEDFLRNLPDSCLCIIYIKDEGTASLTSSLQNLLKSFGSKISLKGKYRWSYIFIFEKKREKFKNIYEKVSPDRVFVLKIKLKIPSKFISFS